MNKLALKIVSGIAAVSAAVLLVQGGVRAEVPSAQAVVSNVAINSTNFPDSYFRDVVKTFDDGDNKLTPEEIHAVTEISLSDEQIKNITGIQYFTNVEDFACRGIQVLKMDLRALEKLTTFYCFSAPKCSQILLPSNLSRLKDVEISNTLVTSLDLSDATDMGKFRADDNDNLEEVNLTGCEELESLYLNNDPKLTTLKAPDLPHLTTFYCNKSGFTDLDVSAFTGLSFLSCNGGKFTTLDLTENRNLRTLYCYQDSSLSTKIKVLNVAGLDGLSYINCSNNEISVLNTTNKDIFSLICSHNLIKTLDLSSSTSLTSLECSHNALTSLDLSASPSAWSVGCADNQITTLKFAQTTSLNSLSCEDNKIKALDLSLQSKLMYLNCQNNELTVLKLPSVSSLVNISCGNNAITSLDVSGCANLVELYCYDNALKSVKLGRNASLQNLLCANNSIAQLDLSGLESLEWLECNINELTSLNLSDCSKMRHLSCYSNKIKSINIDACPTLIQAAKGNLVIGHERYHGAAYQVVFYKFTGSGTDGGELVTDLTTGIVSSCLTPTPTPLAKPSNLKAELESQTSIKVSWNAVPNAQKYMIVYIGLQGEACVDFSFDYIYTEGTSYLFEELLPETDYTFKVAAYYTSPRFPNPFAETSLSTPNMRDISVEIGKSFVYKVPDYDAADIKWSIGNPAVATVDANGKVTGKSVGNTYLHAELPDETSISCLIRVVYPLLSIRYSEKTLHINQTFQFAATNAYGNKITWSVGNTSVATVDANGKVTGKKAANTYLYAKSADGRVAKCLLKVIDPGTLGINYTEKTVYLGQSFKFTAKNAGILPVTWSVGNTAVAKVDSNGKVTPVSVGNTYLYAKTADGRVAKCLVKVVDPGPLNIRYTEKTIKVGSSFQFAAKNPAGQTVTWRVGNTAVATVDANGNVTGKKAANTWLYASTPDGRETKCLIKVVA